MNKKHAVIMCTSLLLTLACAFLNHPFDQDIGGIPSDEPLVVSQPTTSHAIEATCDAENWKIAITGVDEVDWGNGIKNVFVRVGVENNGSLWGQVRGPDNDEDTETQKSVYITTNDGSYYGYLSNFSINPPPISVFGQDATEYEARGAIVTAIIPPGFAILGQTVLGKPHYYRFAFQMPDTQVPDSITISNLSIWCIVPPIIGENGQPSYGGAADSVPTKTYDLKADISNVHPLPTTDNYPNLIGSELDLPSKEGVIEFTEVTRNGNMVNVVANVTNLSANEFYVPFNGYIIGDSRLSTCQIIGEYQCDSQPAGITVPSGQSIEGVTWSFFVLDSETNLMFAYVYGGFISVDHIYRIYPK